MLKQIVLLVLIFYVAMAKPQLHAQVARWEKTLDNLIEDEAVIDQIVEEIRGAVDQFRNDLEEAAETANRKDNLKNFIDDYMSRSSVDGLNVRPGR